MNRRTFLKFFGLLPALPLAARLPAVSEPVTLAGKPVEGLTLEKITQARLLLDSNDVPTNAVSEEQWQQLADYFMPLEGNIDMDALRREFNKNL